MDRMTAGQHAALQMICEDIARQLPWVLDNQRGLVGPRAWRDFFVAAHDRAAGYNTKIGVAIDGIGVDGGGFDLVYRPVARLNITEGSDIRELASAFAVERGVKLREPR